MSVSHIKLRGKPCIAFIFQQFQLISSECPGEFPVKSKVITCKNTYSFSCNIYMCSQSENYGDFRQCVIPVTITCTLQAGAVSTRAPRLGKTTSVARRRLILFCKIEVRPRSCRSYPDRVPCATWGFPTLFMG